MNACRPHRLLGLRIAHILVMFALCAGAAVAATVTPFRVGFIDSSFANANIGEAKAAFNLFTSSLAKRRNIAVQSSTEVYDDVGRMVRAITNRALDLAVISSWDYLHVDISGYMDPRFVTGGLGGGTVEQVLLVRTNAGVKTLSELRGREVAVMWNSGTAMGKPWLETILLRDHLGAPDDFFGRVVSVSKPSASILPVFFGRLAACVVDQASWETMTELNPQVGRQLRAFERSERFVDYLICVTRFEIGPDGARDVLLDALRSLHEDPAGQQICTLFKISRLVTFRPECLDTVQALKSMRDRFRASGRSASVTMEERR